MEIKKATVQDVAQAFLKSFKLSYRSTTATLREITINKYIYEILGKDTDVAIMGEQDTLLDYKKRIANLELSIERKNLILTTYKDIVQRAIHLHYMEQDSFHLVDDILTRFKKESKKGSKREKKFYTKEEYMQFKKAIKNEYWNTLFDTLFYGGFRIGELLGITPADVKDNYIDVNKAFNKENRLVPPKTSNSYRKVYFSKEIFNEILKFIKDNNIKNNERLFQVSRSEIERRNKYFANKSKLERINIHGYRHSCCSLLLQAYITNNKAINFKQIASHLGDSVSTVMETYAHLYPSAELEIYDLI